MGVEKRVCYNALEGKAASHLNSLCDVSWIDNAYWYLVVVVGKRDVIFSRHQVTLFRNLKGKYY